MKNNKFFSKVKDKYLEIENNIVSWIQNNKKIAIILVSLLSIMLICIILLISVSKGKKKPEKVYNEKLELSQELVVPNGPELPRDYTISRQSKEAWSDEEAEKWFSIPSATDIDGLSEVNNNIIDNILEGTP